MQTIDQKILNLIQLVGMSVVSTVVSLYVLFYSNFAEYHFQFSFLDFPLFIGELLFIFCGFLVACKWIIQPPTWNRYSVVILLYILFVAYKGITGYLEWGPLACRYTALFYYPLFALIAMQFIDGNQYVNIFKKIILGIIILTFAFFEFSLYWTLTYFCCGLLIIRTFPFSRTRTILTFLLFIVTPYSYLFLTSRSLIIGEIVFILVFLFGRALIHQGELRKNLISVFCILCVAFGLTYVFVGKDRLLTIFDFKRHAQTLKDVDQQILKMDNRDSSLTMNKVKIYNPNEAKGFIRNSTRTIHPNIEFFRNAVLYLMGKKDTSRAQEKLIFDDTNVQIDYSNTVFRLVVWRDALREIRQYKPIIGFSFGKPFRSRSLEAVSWAKEEWQRDGWIAMHNSFLNIFYRSGVVGLVIIGGLFFITGRMMYIFIQLKSLEGIILCSIIFSWFAATNFLLFLELPDTAIPIWTLFGVTYAFKNHLSMSGEYELGK